MKSIYSLLTVLLIFTNAYASDLTSLQSCVDLGYKGLNDRHSIVAGVLDGNNEIISTYGAAKESQLFEIGSITKTFTANLLAQSVTDKKIEITDLIPMEYQKSSNNITFEHLTTHTSGIIGGLFPEFKSPYPFQPFFGLNESLFKDLYKKTPLDSLPGTGFMYSNIGSSLLGLILSEIEGGSYQELVKNNIFNQLEMNETYFEVPENEMERFPLGYIVIDGQSQETPHWDLFKTAINPAGGIRSTIRDMVKYARANLIPASTSLSESISKSHEPLYYIEDKNMWIGMNWIVQPDENLVWHNGQTYGFNSILVISKESGLAVVAMTNTSVLKVDEDGKQFFDTGLQDVVFNCFKQ